ncbi:MAG: hypothetical protein FJ387_05275 [Verrucomicrobia bacterium]|nr:hypothetical protein [Verrucomicrobiota bacterium]
MNTVTGNWDRAKAGAWFVGIAGTLLIVGWLTHFVVQRTRPPGIDQARAELRLKNLAELRAENQTALTSYGWIDKNKGLVRLPIARAIELTLARAQDPAAARQDLLERLEKATAKPPPPPNPYE